MDVATPFNISAEKEAEMMSLPIPKPVFQVISNTCDTTNNQRNVPKSNNSVSISHFPIWFNGSIRNMVDGNS